METALRGLGAANSLAANLHDGGALLSAAKTAYTSAVGVAFATGSAIMLLMAVIALAMFREKRSA